MKNARLHHLFCFALCWGLVTSADAANNIEVKALFSNRAVMEIDGELKTLKAGDSFAGVTLVEANSKNAVIEVGGVSKTLQVGRRMGAVYAPAEKPSVRIASHTGGHYRAPGRINQRPVEFLVDTGATTIAFNARTAQQLGIDYLKGQQHQVETANGMVVAYQVLLNSVAVGNIVLHNVEASVLEGDFPQVILLGNSYLSRVNMQVDDGVLVLQAKF